MAHQKLSKLTEVLQTTTDEWGVAHGSVGQTLKEGHHGSPEHCWQPLWRNKKDETTGTRKKNPFLGHYSSGALYG